MLDKVIKETEKLGIIIEFLDLKEHGRHLILNNTAFIFVNKHLSDTEKINVILHERSHFKNKDTENSLSKVPTYIHNIETLAETDRILDFMSLLNHEYPIDESFNYIDFMSSANIPRKFENLVKEAATQIYQDNLHNKLI